MNISILTDNPKSWIVPYAAELARACAMRGHRVTRCTRAADLPTGDIACLLSCERLVPPEILRRHRHNLVVHESALPKGRGWSPLTWQVLEGKREIPITLFEATDAVDAGPIYATEVLRFHGHELIGELRAAQGSTTVAMILRFLDAYAHVRGVPQEGDATMYRRRTPEDSMLDPNRTIAEQFDLLRVVDNDRYPAWFSHRGHTFELRVTERRERAAGAADGDGISRGEAAADSRVLAVLQARTSSTRLPGKVLKPILGEPMLARQIERIRRSRRIDEIVVATSTEASDDELAAFCERLGVVCRRGSLTDVLDRVYRAAEPSNPTHVVRLTGDCPLADPALIDECIAFAIDGGYDYATNCKPYTYPDGLDVEVVTFAALAQAAREADLPLQREHVLPFVHRQPERYFLGYLRSPVPLAHHRWTVDEPEDFALVTAVYEALYPTNPSFTTQDVLDFLATRPDLLRINAHHERNAGRKAALAKDAAVLAAQSQVTA